MNSEESSRTGRRTFIKATGALGVGAGIALTSTAAASAETASDVSPDSFDNQLGGVILTGGSTAFWWYDFGGAADRHVQVAGANILQPLNGVRHSASNYGKAHFSSGYVQYYIDIRNTGAVSTTHNLEGGGLT